MEKKIMLQIEKLHEGCYLATSDAVQGLVAQGRTVAETIEIARDVAKKLIEAREENVQKLSALEERFEYPLVISV